eukprot:3966991-Karenia_brevis.AAC.1
MCPVSARSVHVQADSFVACRAFDEALATEASTLQADSLVAARTFDEAPDTHEQTYKTACE